MVRQEHVWDCVDGKLRTLAIGRREEKDTAVVIRSFAFSVVSSKVILSTSIDASGEVSMIPHRARSKTRGRGVV